MDRVQQLFRLAGVDIEEQIVIALEGENIGLTLRAGMAGGVRHFVEDSYAALQDMSPHALQTLFLRLTYLYVAEHQQAEVVGAVLASPPGGIIVERLRLLQAKGAPLERQLQAVNSGALRISRIKAVGVSDDFRRLGVGAALVGACTSTYIQLGYSIIYGTMPSRPGIDAFYGSLGFTVLPPGTPLPLHAADFPGAVKPDPTERIFFWRDSR